MSGEVREPARVVSVRRSRRYRVQSGRYHMILMTESHEIILLDGDEFENYIQGMKSPSSKKWLKTMQSEIDSKNQLYGICPVHLPYGYQAIGNKRVFKLKKGQRWKIKHF